MKTAMKRLLSFVLVAMMLVSVLPFQASAAEGDNTDGGNTSFKVTFKFSEDDKTEVTVDDGVFTYPTDLPEGTYEKVDAKVWLFSDGSVYNGAPLNVTSDITLTAKDPEPQPEAPKPVTVKVYVQVGDGDAAEAGTITANAEGNVSYADVIKAAEAKFDGKTVDRVTYKGASNWPDIADGGSVNVDDIKGDGIYVVLNAPAAPTQPAETPTQPSTEPTQPEKKEYTVTFIFCPEKEDNCDENVKCDGETVVRTTKDGKLSAYDVPTVPSRYGYTFAHWYNETNKTNGLLDTYTSDVTYKAVYEEKADSNMHKLKVYGITYNHGKTNTISTPLATLYVEDNTNLLTALKGATAKIKAALNESPYSEKNDFEWDGVTFYDDDDMNKEDEVSSGTKVTGDGNYYVKVKYTGNDKVQIYVHTSKSMKIKDTVTLTTYAPGETITKSKIIDAVEDKGWSYKYFYTYTENEWAKIVDGGTADQTKSFTVKDGVTEIHVYLTNASSSGSTNKSDNPKTGDTILMAVTVMGLSATALAAAYVFMKKRAI